MDYRLFANCEVIALFENAGDCVRAAKSYTHTTGYTSQLQQFSYKHGDWQRIAIYRKPLIAKIPEVKKC